MVRRSAVRSLAENNIEPMSPPPFLRFETLVKRLLMRRGFQILESQSEARVDVFATREAERWVVEIKFYRTARAQVALLDAAAATVVVAGQQLEAQRGM